MVTKKVIRKKILKKCFATAVTPAIFFTSQTLFTLNEIQSKFVGQHKPPIKVQAKLDTTFSKTGILEALAKKEYPIFEPNEPTSFYTEKELSQFFIIKTKKVHDHLQIICQHSDLPGYILKLTVQSKNCSKANDRNISRVTGATQMRDYCTQHNFEFIVIPKKYLYHIPGKNPDLNDNNYIVVAEKLDIMDAKQSEQNLIHCTNTAISQLKTLIKRFGYKDVWFDNIRIMFNGGKITIIDTEQFKGFDNKNPKKWNSYPLLKNLDGMIGKMKLNKYLNADTPPPNTPPMHPKAFPKTQGIEKTVMKVVFPGLF